MKWLYLSVTDARTLKCSGTLTTCLSSSSLALWFMEWGKCHLKFDELHITVDFTEMSINRY